MRIEELKVAARKRAIGPKWGYEVQEETLPPMFGIDIMREIECQISAVGKLKWKRYDDEATTIIFRCWLG